MGSDYDRTPPPREAWWKGSEAAAAAREIPAYPRDDNDQRSDLLYFMAAAGRQFGSDLTQVVSEHARTYTALQQADAKIEYLLSLVETREASLATRVEESTTLRDTVSEKQEQIRLLTASVATYRTDLATSEADRRRTADALEEVTHRLRCVEKAVEYLRQQAAEQPRRAHSQGVRHAAQLVSEAMSGRNLDVSEFRPA